MTKILVIEDDRLYRENILDLLKEEEYQTISAENGYIGLQLAQLEIPDLILCDVIMPELDGYGVITSLRENPMTAAIPFIFMTSKADRSDIRMGMELGADDYITKPFSREEILKSISSRLQRKKMFIQPYTEALKQTEERLNHLLHYDSITNLPNRLLLRELFAEIIKQKQEDLLAGQTNITNISNPEITVPILVIGLDQFFRIQNSLDYQSRDILIKQIAERISWYISREDTLARLNEDQFVLIMANIFQKTTVVSIAETILAAICEPYKLDNIGTICVTASIGITFYSQDDKELDNLMKEAELAMNNIQNLGGNYYQIYELEQTKNNDKNLLLKEKLSQALETNQFQVYYQPVVSLSSGKIIGAEALVRWQDGEEFVPPAKFIPLAEESGLIVAIGDWILTTAITQAQQWISQGFSSFQISVNLSSRQFYQGNLKAKITDILAATNMQPENLQLELTESSLVENAGVAIASLTELKQLGIRIAIDDFGTGYTSLNYLKKFPFNTLKIDPCFVRNISNIPQNRAIVTAVIKMAHNLQLQVIGEGVETIAEKTFLQDHKCDGIQGYLFSYPLPASEFEILWRSQKSLTLI